MLALMISRGRFHNTAKPFRVVDTGCRTAATTVDRIATMTRFLPVVMPVFACSIRRLEEVLEQDTRTANSNAMIPNCNDGFGFDFAMMVRLSLPHDISWNTVRNNGVKPYIY